MTKMTNLTVNFTAEYSIMDDERVVITMSILYYIVFVACFIGNIVVLLVITLQRSMRTTTNFFLANLAIADLFVGVFCVLPNGLHLAEPSGTWPVGETMCRAYLYMLQLGPCISAALLLLMSVERYIVVLYPISARNLLRPWVLVICTLLAWLTAGLYSIPFFVSANYFGYEIPINLTGRDPNTTVPPTITPHYCSRDDSLINIRLLYTSNFVIWYALPLLIMTGIYFRIGYVLWHSVDNFTKATGSRMSKKKSRRSSSGGSTRLLSSNGNNGIPLITLNGGAGTSYGVAGGGPKPQNGGLKPPQNGGLKPQNGAGSHRPSETLVMSERTGGGVMAHVKIVPRYGSTESEDTSESRRRVVRLLVIIVALFAVLTLPHHSRHLWLHYSHTPFKTSDPVNLWQPISYLLLFINSACNPFLYAFLSERFRLAFVRLATCQEVRAKRYRRGIGRARSDTITSGYHVTMTTPD